MSGNREVKVRIAPSPTGDPHVGTAYIALFNYVFAKKNGGKFVLRIEDTDQTRAKSSSEAQILSSLKWLGLSWDEGPDVGGDFGPYHQSKRLDIYKEHYEQLIASGKAYRCFCTADRLQALREEQKAAGKQTKYDGKCRDMSQEEAAKLVADGVPSVVRLKMPLDGTTKFNDELRGAVEINNEQLDDQVLIKSDGFPTYHFANVVDDHLMHISHVIRAEEWISSTPKHVLLYEAFGWDEPTWIHMPLLRNTDKSKISKRKNPVSLDYYHRAGILPEAMVNFLALMGWSYGDDQEIFSLDQMIEVFDFRKVSLGGPIFDQVKLNWVNQHYMHQMNEDQFVNYVREQIFSEDYLRKMKPLVLERMSRFEQFTDNNQFFFNGALNYDGLAIVPKGKEKGEMKKMVKGLVEKLDDLYEWDVDHIEACLKAYKDELGWKPKDFFMPIRLMITGRKDSPPLNETIEVLGREIVRFRLRDFIQSSHLK
ncbi:glutamate--tRNA ligase [Pseudobacteriovorax antillogorgiicola]|uniref:Glutamate--tRNA ligase n=1 Tax=Pseudobacteriovorax antillogorgiicola TaxID=1513793 RepID=A0A1Y6B215_9BACT|nr:glutamate--tRNA ligase [Pseudobacteriovorax antillogorgiicola]TCS59559.1 glutamyl-tRNA synthetase [Pseudobacteriovorax antillogorgiicola]SME87715.1 glutamyl-tRNA synthetase [Pseudobacteriovorax antillogorgiicola]